MAPVTPEPLLYLVTRNHDGRNALPLDPIGDLPLQITALP
jgi:hypothetical protein